MARNRYAGTCYRCGKLCLPGEGYFEKVGVPQRKKWPLLPSNLKWQLQHTKCARQYAGTDVHHIHNPDHSEREN